LESIEPGEVILESMGKVDDEKNAMNSQSHTWNAGGKGHLVEGGC
jgi:hypothetical protein